MTAPQPGDFFLTEISGDVGKGIRIGQFLVDGNYANLEHAGIFLGDGAILEAEPGGARIGSISEYSTIRWSSGLVPLTDPQRQLIVETAKARVGVPYSFADYGAIAAHHFHLPVPGLKAFINHSGHQICSQMTDWVYEVCGVQLFKDGRWPGDVMPADLDKLLNEKESP